MKQASNGADLWSVEHWGREGTVSGNARMKNCNIAAWRIRFHAGTEGADDPPDWFYTENAAHVGEVSVREGWEVEALGVAPSRTALARFIEDTSDLAEMQPLERLRYFCSLAMNGQDWLDAEPFFKELERALWRDTVGWEPAMIRCPFCKNDPFHYVHNGLGMEAVAVDCCDLGVTLYSRDPHNEADRRSLYRVLRLRRSHSPRRKARAARILEALYAKWEQ